MNRSRDELLLAFLEGELSDPERASLLDQIESDPELADAVRAAARGMAAVRFIHDVGLSIRPDPERSIDAERARAALLESMDRLPDDQREAITLRFAAGLPYDEIARITNAAMGTVASRVFRGLRRLGDDLDARHLEIVD